MDERTELRQLVTLQRGQSYKSAQLGEPGPVLLGLGTINRNGGFRGEKLKTYGGPSPEKSLLRPGDLYVSLKDVTHAADLLGSVARVPDAVPLGRLTQDTIRLDVNEDRIDRDYLYWALRDPAYRSYCRLRGTGTTNLDLSREDFLAYKLILPKRSAQRGIARTLGALDDRIAANVKIAGIAEELITAHYQKAVSRPGMLEHRLFEVVDVDFGEPFKGAEFTAPGEGRPLIRIRDLKTFRSQVWTSEKRAREVLVSPGDVVVGMDAEFRPTTWLGEAGLLNQRVCRVRGKIARDAFVREALRTPLMRIENSKSATTVIHLNKSDLERVELAIPVQTELRIFEEKAEPLYRYSVSLAMENRTLAATRDALLPQLMSGALRVKDAEKALEGVI